MGLFVEIGQNEATPVEGICPSIGGLENKSISKKGQGDLWGKDKEPS